MSVLEDAIREHLDLKRKHGASDAELNEQEAEALGPGHRDAPEGEVEEAEHAEAVEPVAVDEPPVVEAPVEEPQVPEAEPPEAALPEAGRETPRTPADPDFGGETPQQKPPQRDFDFE